MDFYKSKKFWTMIAGVLVAMVVNAVPELSEYQDAMVSVIAIMASYIIGQGIADQGKYTP